MINAEIRLRTNDKNEVPEIMEEIAEKIKSGMDMSKDEKYFFKFKNQHND